MNIYFILQAIIQYYHFFLIIVQIVLTLATESSLTFQHCSGILFLSISNFVAPQKIQAHLVISLP